ncbi:LPS export ABC transporter permease LptG [Novosphingobium mangrovi (ex Huang et al. 2023)]|uniref:LPS export ABC transporter permease LptG n=1 Tax=Novosphingobium mangrovi (ex Huang et al. 2023) TaxID=2976432 RepID=A0ABT2HZK6_9SPHN|nr:LPS export ABC transporter permease LptG [Novosphingobium mangrovi (ex Huang et al. 2023)]MCT2397986.1 LPS export ABC transporter permease LptG [Novosphingobium mangrovi (ex Huang et al. 2023)]
MQLEFFPSRTLTFYLARLFITRILAMLLMLVLVLQVLDLLGESGDILAYSGNGEGQLLYYVSLRIPQLIARFLPYSVLLATIITLATLNQNSEVISMKAAGLSAHQVLAPLMLTALVISGVSFVFNERVVTRATATLDAWHSVDYGPVPEDSGVRTNLYLSDGRDMLLAKSLNGRGKDMVMTGVTFYRRDANDMVVEQLRSPRATFANPGWKLENPERFEVAGTKSSRLAEAVVAPGITPGKVMLSKVDADSQDIFTLASSIEALKVAGRRTSELDAAWWHKISGPLSSTLMPLLGAVAAFGLARSGQLLIRAMIGMALGFAYFVFDNAALAMGNFGGYPPFVAAWAPFVLFALIGETVLIRTEE